MLFPADLDRMRLGVRWEPGRVHEFTPMAGDAPLPGAWSRIVGTPRISGDNQKIGDCVPTGCVNAIQTAMARKGTMTPIPNSVPLAAYSAVTGYRLDDPASDLGTDPLTMFAWWAQYPLAGWKLRGYTGLDPTSEYAIRRTIETAGGVALVIKLATEQQNERVWTPAGTPGSWGLHMLWADTYDGALTFGTSWGEAQGIDRAYFAAGFVAAAFALDVVPA